MPYNVSEQHIKRQRSADKAKEQMLSAKNIRDQHLSEERENEHGFVRRSAAAVRKRNQPPPENSEQKGGSR